MNGFSLALALGMIAGPAAPQDTASQEETFVPYIARVTGDSVHVRSGPSTVYYHIASLKFDARVRVVGHKYGFAKIDPPEGTYSLVKKDFVEIQGDGKGVLNGTAWSHADAADGAKQDAYAKQVRLAKGTEVDLVEELDNYYRIVPPPGAVLYISRDFIAPLDAQQAAAAATNAASPQGPQRAKVSPKRGPGRPSPQMASKPRTPAKRSTPVPGEPRAGQGTPEAGSESNDRTAGAATPEQPQLATEPRKVTEHPEIVRLEAEVARIRESDDAMQRDYTEVIEAFQTLSQNHEDQTVQRYAQFRADQMRRIVDRMTAMGRLVEIETEIKKHRHDFSEQRSRIQPTPPPVRRDFAVIGQMRKSFAYTSPVGPRRYRIIDPDDAGQKTLAYIEIEEGSPIDPQKYLGRHVGVRARTKRLIEGTVDAIEVYTVAEIVILEQAPVELSSSQQ